MKKLASLCLLFLAMYARAQTFTVTGTGITDSDGIMWAYGTVSVAFVPNPSQPNPSLYTLCSTGASLDPTILNQGPLTIGSGASFSVTVYDNSAVCPVGSQWKFTICPNASDKCGSVTMPITASQDITSDIEANIQAPRFHPVSGSYGYSDVEAILSLAPGSTYWNVTSLAQRCYNATPPAAWGVCNTGGGGGGGATPYPPAYSIQVANAGVTDLISDPFITENLTNHTLNIGGSLPTNYATISNLAPVSASWIFDITSPTTAFNSIQPLTTKGDLLGFSTATGRFSIGANGLVLTADSTQPFGFAWEATPAGISGLTGDGTASGSGTVPFTLATVNGAPGICGDATHVCQVTTNGKGLVISQSAIAIGTGTDTYFSVTGCTLATEYNGDSACQGTGSLGFTAPDTSYMVFCNPSYNSASGSSFIGISVSTKPSSTTNFIYTEGGTYGNGSSAADTPTPTLQCHYHHN